MTRASLLKEKRAKLGALTQEYRYYDSDKEELRKKYEAIERDYATKIALCRIGRRPRHD